jgi:diguanylate cyclase (GGDEF)-like protein
VENSIKLSDKFRILRAESQLETDYSECVLKTDKFGILFFDIDHFKKLNTDHTETVVDEMILKPFQTFLTKLICQRGFGYSVGGDEFIFLLLNVDQVEAIAFGERLLRETSTLTFKVDSKEVKFTLSIGVSSYPQDGQTLGDLRRRANLAEKDAKEYGRNRVVHTSNSPPNRLPELRSSPLPTFTASNDCSFFAERFAGAFPGVRGIAWFSGDEAVRRLMLLLKQPLTFSSSNGGEITPIWWLRFDNNAISHFEVLTNTSVLIDHKEMDIKRICAVHSNDYKKLFVYLEADPLPPTGLYPRSEAEFNDALNSLGYVWEEYGLFRSTHLANRAEYDDNSTVINGVVVSMNGECLLRTRYISKYNLVICANQSPINDQNFDNHLEGYLNRMLRGEDCISELRDEVKRLRNA